MSRKSLVDLENNHRERTRIKIKWKTVMKYVFDIGRYSVAFFNLLSALFKFPVLFVLIKFAVQLSMTKPDPDHVPLPPDEPDPNANPEDKAALIAKLAINAGFVLFLFLLSIVVLIFSSIAILKQWRNCLITYYAVIGIWIIFVYSAIFAEYWHLPGNVAIIIAKIFLHGWWVLPAPSTAPFAMLRVSVYFDLTFYLISIVVLAIDSIYNFSGTPPFLICRRPYDMIKTI